MMGSFEEQLAVADFIDSMRGRVPAQAQNVIAKRITNVVALTDALERAAYAIVALENERTQGFRLTFTRRFPFVSLRRQKKYLTGVTDLNTIGRVLQEVEGRCPPEIVFSEWGPPLRG